MPPAGDTVVLQSAIAVVEGAVGPKARSNGPQLTLTVGLTVGLLLPLLVTVEVGLQKQEGARDGWCR